eukprot:PhM_4_TR2485/c0_g1_i1/m.33986
MMSVIVCSIIIIVVASCLPHLLLLLGYGYHCFLCSDNFAAAALRPHLTHHSAILSVDRCHDLFARTLSVHTRCHRRRALRQNLLLGRVQALRVIIVRRCDVADGHLEQSKHPQRRGVAQALKDGALQPQLFSQPRARALREGTANGERHTAQIFRIRQALFDVQQDLRVWHKVRPSGGEATHDGVILQHAVHNGGRGGFEAVDASLSTRLNFFVDGPCSLVQQRPRVVLLIIIIIIIMIAIVVIAFVAVIVIPRRRRGAVRQQQVHDARTGIRDGPRGDCLHCVALQVHDDGWGGDRHDLVENVVEPGLDPAAHARRQGDAVPTTF